MGTRNKGNLPRLKRNNNEARIKSGNSILCHGVLERLVPRWRPEQESAKAYCWADGWLRRGLFGLWKHAIGRGQDSNARPRGQTLQKHFGLRETNISKRGTKGF